MELLVRRTIMRSISLFNVEIGKVFPSFTRNSVCDLLIGVETYICQKLAAGVDGEELYEEVQYTPSFVPRLYLMILVGSCCIRMKKIPAKKIIYDTLEMCKGIQHPMRGLFLRNFFIREMKDKFPYPGFRFEMYVLMSLFSFALILLLIGTTVAM